MASLFSRQRNPNMEKALFDWPIVLQYDVKAKYRLISRKFSGMKFFHLSVRLTNEKPDAFVCPFDKPIKSLCFRSFVISVLFARFHFKVIRKSLYWLFTMYKTFPEKSCWKVNGTGLYGSFQRKNISGAAERLKSPVFPDKMFQTEIQIPFFQIHL